MFGDPSNWDAPPLPDFAKGGDIGGALMGGLGMGMGGGFSGSSSATSGAEMGAVNEGGFAFGDYGPTYNNYGAGSINTDTDNPETRQVKSMAALGFGFLVTVALVLLWPKKGRK